MTLLLGSAITGAVAVHEDSLGRNPVAQPLMPDVGTPGGPNGSPTPVVVMFGAPPLPAASTAVSVIPASLSVSDDVAVLTQRVSFAPAPSGTISPASPIGAPPWNSDQPEQSLPVEQPGASPSDVVTEPAGQVTEPAGQTTEPVIRLLAHTLETASEPTTAPLEPVTMIVDDTATPAMSMLAPVLGIIAP